MTNFKNIVAVSATAACVAIGQNANAQEDLESLLSGTDDPVMTEDGGAEADLDALDSVVEDDDVVTDDAPEATDDASAVDDEPATDDGDAADATDKPEPAATPKASSAADDAALLEAMEETAKLQIRSFEMQAEREIDAAMKCEEAAEYLEMVRHYALAMKLLSDSPKNAKKRKECETGIANGLYAAAIQEHNTGRHERAIKLITKALEHRHPKARRQLEAWNAAGDPEANKKDLTDIMHERNAEGYKKERESIDKHLKRASQLLATNKLKAAIDECELVLLMDEYNTEAMRLRDQIERKRLMIGKVEFHSAREGYIAEVGEAWRPAYAVDVREVKKVSHETKKTPLDPTDPERAQEQTIISRMKEMRLPAISFKPPTTIIEAVEFFRTASKDFDRPDLPIEQRGFNFVLKTPQTLRTSAPSVEEDQEEGGFTEEAEETASPTQAGVPVIPMISASDISFYDALKLVCESVEYKFTVKGPIVMVMHKDATIAEMVTRSYPVLSTFIDRMDTATEDMRTMGNGTPFGNSNASDDGEENKEKDWKGFFELLGVKWPEGSSIMYIKTIGKLRVRNTSENLAELEQALTEMNADPKLIEIETRFVEVCQEDLNSLGFEWILNSDYTLNLGSHLSRALGLRNGVFGERLDANGSSGADAGNVTVGGVTTSVSGSSGTAGGSSINQFASSNGATWIRGDGNRRNVGINAMGGTSDYGSGNRYLSTLSNHISGEGKSTNDQFMRVNAFLGAADLSVILHMLSQRSDTDLLSAPKVLTTSGQEAVMKVVTEYIYPTDYDVQLQSSSSGGGGNYGGGSQSAILAVVEPQSFTMREVGVILDVTPTLTDDGNLIDLELNTMVVDEPTWKNYGMRIPFTGNSALQNFEGIGGIFEGLTGVLGVLGAGLSDTMRAAFAETAVNSATAALDSLTRTSNDNITYYDAPMEQPFFHVRSVVSKIQVYPGATIVMGGLITEQRKAMDDKIPFLGDLPFIGRLFRSHAEQTKKRNLLIFVTTRLVDTQGRELRPRDQEERGAEVVAAPTEEN